MKDAMPDRVWLEHVLSEAGAMITDTGFDMTNGTADLVYELDGERTQLTIKVLS